MSRIRGKDTTPERIVRSLLHRMTAGCRGVNTWSLTYPS
jgi:G:T-mismatch repair DNA endonuclease (very short patch repair protein)